MVLKLRLNGLERGGDAVLGAINLDLKPGQTVALVGPSGIGKSSLLRVIAGLETGFDGTCHVQGRLAMVFQEPTLLDWRSLRDNLIIPTGIPRSEADAALDEIGLKARADAFPGHLSLGQRRRLSLARAFAAKPDLLLLDEPFVSLDRDLVQEMMGLFATMRAARGVASLLVTHSMEEARALADRIVTLSGHPARIDSDVQNKGAYFQLSASGVTSSRS